uniref:hypothetical protein n=2 Tax=Flavobacterium sp. TaxID=239 RepID=UPI00404ABCDE
MILCLPSFSQEFKKEEMGSETTIQESIVGKWSICVFCKNGLEANPNHCPEITFFEGGEGVLDASEPSSDFQWKVKHKQIIFSFKTERDKKLFLSHHLVYTFNLYHERGSTFLKLITNDSKSWYLLSK